MLHATRQRWESCLYHQPKQVLDLATPKGCKAELTYVTWKPTGRELNPRPVNQLCIEAVDLFPACLTGMCMCVRVCVCVCVALVLVTANFQESEHGELMFKYLQQVRQPGMPLMVMEFWTGWFDHWTEQHHVVSNASQWLFLNAAFFTALLLACRWRGGAMARALDLRSTGRGFKSYSRQKLCNNLGQVVQTYVPLSPSSITWYRPRAGDALRLGR